MIRVECIAPTMLNRYALDIRGLGSHANFDPHPMNNSSLIRISNMIAEMPLSLQQKAVLLESHEYAWTMQDALEVVDFYRLNHLGILGGDVLERAENSKIAYTKDNWFINYKHDDWLNYVSQSCELAMKKILFFSNRFPDKNLLFVLVTSKEQ